MTRVFALLLVLFAMFVAAPARAADPDPWFSKDKVAHFGVAAGIAAGSYAVSSFFLDARGYSLLVGAGVTMAAGTGKELLDLAGYGDPSWKDFAWDAIGCVAGLAVAWSVDLLIRGVSSEHPLFSRPEPHEPGKARAGITLPRLMLSF